MAKIDANGSIHGPDGRFQGSVRGAAAAPDLGGSALEHAFARAAELRDRLAELEEFDEDAHLAQVDWDADNCDRVFDERMAECDENRRQVREAAAELQSADEETFAVWREDAGWCGCGGSVPVESIQQLARGACGRCGSLVDESGRSLVGCEWSRVRCRECGDRPCDGSC